MKMAHLRNGMPYIIVISAFRYLSSMYMRNRDLIEKGGTHSSQYLKTVSQDQYQIRRQVFKRIGKTYGSQSD
jgi:hypothetical protein